MRLFTFILSLFLLAGIQTASNAQEGRYAREEHNVGFVESVSTEHDVQLVSRPAYIYAVTVWADAANSYAFLYDTSAAPAASDKPKVEVGEASQYDSVRTVFDPPLQMSTGIYADVTSGSIVVEYR